MNLISPDYINQEDKAKVELFLFDKNIKKFILGINKLAKSVQKHIEVDGIIDDFTRVQSSRKKSVYKIDEVPKDALILSTSTGSPLEVIQGLEQRGFSHINYLSFYKYSNLELANPPFITDFKEDYKENYQEYKYTYDLLKDEKSKEIFEKVINFKISFDFKFMEGFTNNHEEQYFEEELIPKLKDIVFVDGGAYVGDTLPNIIRYFPDFKKIYCFEPNELHLNIAKRDFGTNPKIEFINCGLGNKIQDSSSDAKLSNNCAHDYQALKINTLDNLIPEKVDFIKLDIEGAEQDAIKGAKETIQKYKPIIAVCVYHKAEDWYKIPKMILEYENAYDVYLRHYMEGIFETVMYFIPKSLFA